MQNGIHAFAGMASVDVKNNIKQHTVAPRVGFLKWDSRDIVTIYLFIIQ